MEYIKEGNTIPAPLNIIPTPKKFVEIFNKVSKFLKKQRRHSTEIDQPKLAKNARQNQEIEILNLPTPSNRKKSTNSSELTYIVNLLHI